MRDDDRGLMFGVIGMGQRLAQRAVVVSVDFHDMPAEARPAARHLYLQCVVAEVEALQVVVVDHGDQVVQAEVIGELRRLPHLALVAFAVAQHREGAEAFAVLLCRQRPARRHGKTVTQRAGGEIHPRHQMGHMP